MRQHPVVVLTGPRQVGKTTLAKELFSDREWVTLDLPSEAEQAERDPESFLARHPAPLVIDEVQYAPGLFRHLKRVVDERRDVPGQFLLSGSQEFTLMKAVSDSLAGRSAVIRLEGLCWSEIHSVQPDVDAVDLVLRGGFPELWAKPEMDALTFYRSYIATYLERDLRQQLAVGSLRDFERFIRAAALRTACVLNQSDLARDVGISPSTAGHWLSALKASGQLVLLEPWFSNRGKSLVKAPKIHMCDSGLASFLCGLRSREDLLRAPMAGNLWESAVFAELRRHQSAEDGGWEGFYWRDRSKEVDFFQHRGGRYRLADAKWTEQPDASDLAQLRHVAALLPKDSVELQAVVGRNRNSYPLQGGGEAITAEEIGRRWITPSGSNS